MSSRTAVVERMQALIRQWEQEANSQVFFLSCYCLMTSNMLTALEQHEFQDPAWVDHLLNHFADYYFVALAAYEQDPASSPRVWRLAHDATHNPHITPLQNLLLGVNAHINYDLVLTLTDLLAPEWPGLSEAQRLGRYADYCHVNAIIAHTIDAVQDQVLEPRMAIMSLFDSLLGRMDEWLISTLINHWRETVWRNALQLLEAQEDVERRAILENVEQEAFRLGQLIAR